MAVPATYIIRGGHEGRQRLEVLARVMWPTTSQLLTAAGVTSGMQTLDLGCGGGDVTFQLAERVGPNGSVIGVDLDATKLDAAREVAQRKGLSNASFRELDVCDWNDSDVYDCVYARFLLTHLADPVAVLRQMRRALKLSGVVILEDIDFGGHFCYPPCAAYDRYVELYRATATRRGVDADLGRKLFSFMLDAGWSDIRLHVLQPAFTAGEGKLLALLTLRNIAEAVLSEKLASPEDLDSTLHELQRFTEDPRSVIGMPRIFQLWAQKHTTHS